MERNAELREQIEAGLIAIKAKDASVIQRQVAQMTFDDGDPGGHERDARALIDRLRPDPDRQDGSHVLSAAPELIARTRAWMIFDACTTLRVEIRTATGPSRSAEDALATFTLWTTLFDRFVQQSVAANGHPVGEPRRTDAA
jgi:hypothetical protein